MALSYHEDNVKKRKSTPPRDASKKVSLFSHLFFKYQQGFTKTKSFPLHLNKLYFPLPWSTLWPDWLKFVTHDQERIKKREFFTDGRTDIHGRINGWIRRQTNGQTWSQKLVIKDFKINVIILCYYVIIYRKSILHFLHYSINII